MKYFIGAKNLTGQVIVADMKLERLAEEIVGRGKFRVTAVNEQLGGE
jgi:hypothetical protein